MRAFIAIGGLLVLVLVALVVGPLFVDWTRFRAEFESEASRVLGQPVRVLGEAEARLLPFPSLTFTDVVVGVPDAEPTMTLARFRMDAELAPYLSGEIRIFEMHLDAPHLRIPLSDDGTAVALPGLPGAADSAIVLESVVVTDGLISLRNEETGRSREFSGIDGRFTAATLAGPFTGGGSLDAVDEPMTFALSSGVIAPDGRWPFRLTFGSQRLGASFAFDGATVLGDGAPDFEGTLDVAAGGEAGGEATAPLPPLRVSSAIRIGRREAELSELRAEVGAADEEPYVLTGEGVVDIADVPHFELTLRGEGVDVDRLGGEEAATGPAPSFPERAEAVRRTLAAIPRIDVPGRIAMTLPIVTAGDTAIRNLTVTGSPSEAGWTLDGFSAELPGRTLLEASGVLAVEEELAFTGDILLAARQPQRFATWLTGTAEPAVAALSRAGFSARAHLSIDRQRLEELEVDVGGQRLIGRLERGGDDGVQTLSADLAGEAVDLDAFLAFTRVFTGNAEIGAPVERLDLRLEAGPVRYDGIDAASLSLDFSYDDDLLDLRELIATDLEGLDIDARGIVASLSTGPRPQIAGELTAQAPERFAAFLRERFAAFDLPAGLERQAATLGPLRLAVDASTREGEDAPVSIELNGEAGATDFVVSGTLDGAQPLSSPFDLDLSATGTDPALFLRQFGFEGLDLGLPGPLTLTAKASGGTPGAVGLDAVLRAPGSTLSAEGTVLVAGIALPGLDLALRALSEDASLWLTALGAGFGQGLDAVPLDLAGRLTLSDGGWALRDVAGDVAGTRVEAALDAPLAEAVTGRVALSDLSASWLATLVTGVPLEPPGDGGSWPDQPFGAPLLAQRGYAMRIEADRLALFDGSAVSGLSARLEGDGNGVRLDDLDGTLNDGRLRGTAELRNAGGFASLLFDATLESAIFESSALRSLLSGSLRVEGSGRSYAELVGSLTGGGEVSLVDAVVPGIAPQRLDAIVTASAIEGFEPTGEAVAALAGEADDGASYPLGSLTAPLAVSLGALRVPPVEVVRPGERVTVEGSVDIGDGSATGRLTLAFEPREDDRIEDTAPALAYELAGEPPVWALASAEPLTSYLSLLAYRREEERLEAVRAELRETLRLRREARLYRWRAAERDRIEAERLAALEAERLRLAEEVAERARLAAEREAADIAAREAAQAAARAEREAAAEAEAARRAADAAAAATPQGPAATTPAAPQGSVPQLDFDLPSPPVSPPPTGFEGLPGVQPPPTAQPLPGVGGFGDG